MDEAVTQPDPLRGGVAVVTGGGSGIGEGIGRAAAERGMRVVLVDIAETRAEAVAADLRASGSDAVAMTADVTDPEAIGAVAARIFNQFGPTTLLVNNVGIELLGFTWEIGAEDWRRALDINVLGMANVIRTFVPRMITSRLPSRIAMLSSIGGLGMAPLHSTYMVSKHAVLALSESLSLDLDLAGAPITVSAVLPGPVATRIFEDAPVIGDNAFLVAHHRAMREMLRQHGLPPIEAGRRILAQVALGVFWVSPHPEMLEDVVQRRITTLRNRHRPQLSPDMQREVESHA